MESLPYADAREHLVRDALRRNIALILALGVVFGLVAWLVTSKATASYSSQAKVLIEPTVGNALSPDSATSSQRVTVAMTTEAALVDSPTIAEGVGKELGMSTSDVTDATTASVPANTQLILITFTDDDEATAQKGAQEVADQYLAYRKSQSQAVVKTQVDNLTKQEKAVSESLSNAGKSAAVTDAKPDANAQVQLYASRLATIQNNIATAQATSTNPGSVVMPATKPAAVSNIIDSILVPVAVLLGLLLGFALALWRERRDDRVRGTSEHVIAGAPVLAVVPRKAPGARALATGSDDVVSESYRLARAGVLASRGSKGKVFAVVGAADGVGVADVAANLGIALARAGYSVVVADATGGAESIGRLAGVEATAGFSELLRGESADGTPWTGTDAGVDVVVAGADPASTTDLFHSDAMVRAVAALAGQHDFTILAGAPITSAEGSGVVLSADSTLVVLEERRSTHAQAELAVQRSTELGTPVLGFVTVPVRGKGDSASRPAAPASTSQSAPSREQADAEADAPSDSSATDDDAVVSSAGTRASSD